MKHSTINLSLTSEKSLTDSKLPDTGYLRTKGQESVYETCACVIHTTFYSATCALILSVISHQCLRGVHVLREALVFYGNGSILLNAVHI